MRRRPWSHDAMDDLQSLAKELDAIRQREKDVWLKLLEDAKQESLRKVFEVIGLQVENADLAAENARLTLLVKELWPEAPIPDVDDPSPEVCIKRANRRLRLYAGHVARLKDRLQAERRKSRSISAKHDRYVAEVENVLGKTELTALQRKAQARRDKKK